MYDTQSWNWQNNSNNFIRPLPHYEIIKVNGEAGAKAFQMNPNSSIFLADATNPNIVWLVQTDGAGYPSATPLDVKVHQVEPQPNYSNLEERIKHLEDLYEQLNSGLSKQPKKQRANASVAVEQSANTTN